MVPKVLVMFSLNGLADVLKKKLQRIPYCQLVIGELVWIKGPVDTDLRFERHA